MKHYALGLDYGTNSGRCVVVDLRDGREVATSVLDYPSGEHGILLDASDPNLARQHPADYLDVLKTAVPAALEQARAGDPEFDARRIVGIGVDTTGSTPIPVDERGTPLGLKREFSGNRNAMAWLWKDHTSHSEADRITEYAAAMRPHYLAKCGGTYSSEWFWSKIWHCLNVDPAVFHAADGFVELCDYIPALLAGRTDRRHMVRSICAAGHKAMYSEEWGGLPDEEFLAGLDPALAGLRKRLYDRAVTSDQVAGRLTEEWADTLGLPAGIPIATGALDAHMGAVGAGIREGVLVKILGTSTCDLMVMPADRDLADIPGVCGVVNGSVLPGHYGIEAGQSAVGDIFLWLLHSLAPDPSGVPDGERFRQLNERAAAGKPGEHGLLALDWNNGNRSILADVRLGGLLLGQTLHTQLHEIYRALVEATAFGALTIIQRIEEYAVPVRETINCGGLAVKNPFLMQVHADITGRPMKVAGSDQTCAVGSAIYGAVVAGAAAGGFDGVAAAQDVMCRVRETVYTPIAANTAVYSRMYDWYRTLHDAFGTPEWQGNLFPIMKNLIALREQQRTFASHGDATETGV